VSGASLTQLGIKAHVVAAMLLLRVGQLRSHMRSRRALGITCPSSTWLIVGRGSAVMVVREKRLIILWQHKERS